jgi:hypothetical protein
VLINDFWKYFVFLYINHEYSYCNWELICTIFKYIRSAGLSVNQQLSPVEASLLSVDHQPIAKYTVDQGGGSAIVYLDSQVTCNYVDVEFH